MTNSDKDINIKKKGTVKIKSKLKCMNCGKEITDSGIKLSSVQTVDANGFDVINKMNDNSSHKTICGECEKRLRHPENFLYMC